jgi:hypothetical protein
MTREQLSVCDAICRHFRLRKADVRTEVKEYIKHNGGENAPVIEIDTPAGTLRVGMSKHTIPVAEMLFFKKLEKTDLYADALNLISNEHVDFITFYSGKAVMVMYDAAAYSGLGGIFVKTEKNVIGYVIETIDHYLKDTYSTYFEE